MTANQTLIEIEKQVDKLRSLPHVNEDKLKDCLICLLEIEVEARELDLPIELRTIPNTSLDYFA